MNIEVKEKSAVPTDINAKSRQGYLQRQPPRRRVNASGGSPVIVRLPISPRMSNSGKSKVIASTMGNVKTIVEYEGKPITVGVNAYIPA